MEMMGIKLPIWLEVVPTTLHGCVKITLRHKSTVLVGIVSAK